MPNVPQSRAVGRLRHGIGNGSSGGGFRVVLKTFIKLQSIFYL